MYPLPYYFPDVFLQLDHEQDIMNKLSLHKFLDASAKSFIKARKKKKKIELKDCVYILFDEFLVVFFFTGKFLGKSYYHH